MKRPSMIQTCFVSFAGIAAITACSATPPPSSDESTSGSTAPLAVVSQKAGSQKAGPQKAAAQDACEGSTYCDCGLWVPAGQACPATSCNPCLENFNYCGCGECLVSDLTCSPRTEPCFAQCNGPLRDCGGGIEAEVDSACPNGTLVGDTKIEGSHDYNPDGVAEAFQYTASVSGPLSVLTLYVANRNQAVNIKIGMYDEVDGHPGHLLGQGTIRNVYSYEGWHTAGVPTVNITAGQNYWIAILSPEGGGRLQFRDREAGTTLSEGSAENNLSELPSTWTTGETYVTSSASAYGSR